MFKHFITPEGQACVYMLRDSKLTNVSLEHRGENKTNSSLSFGKIWQMSKAKWCHFFKLRGRVHAEQELQVSVATTALQFCCHPGRHKSWVKRWASSLMSNITRARMGISSWKYISTRGSFSKKFFLLFLNVHYIIEESLSELVRPFSQNTDISGFPWEPRG